MIYFAIFIIWFRIFSPFYIYLTLPYPHKKNRREICSPPSSGTTATSLRLRFHCDCVLHLVLRLLAIDLRPIIAFSIEFSIEFLSHPFSISNIPHISPTQSNHYSVISRLLRYFCDTFHSSILSAFHILRFL